jgi:hypothetical protein
MQTMQRNRQRELQEINEAKQIEKLNRMISKIDKDKLKESIIQPEKIEKSNKDRRKLETDYKASEKNYKPQIEKFWRQRTNEGYKHIIKDRDPTKLNPQKIKEKELIVHTVTDADRNEERIEKEYTNLRNKLEVHDDELKVIYSTTEEAKHKKKFEYEHKYNKNVKYDPSDHNELRDHGIKLLEKEQKKMLKDKAMYDKAIEYGLSANLLTEDELKNIVGIDVDKFKGKYTKTQLHEQKTKQVVSKPVTKPVTKPVVSKPVTKPVVSKPVVTKPTSKRKNITKSVSVTKTTNNRDKYKSRQKRVN